LRSRSPWRWLLAKEWRELTHAPAFWVLLLLTGPLVGSSFIAAVQTYAELSGLRGAGAGAGEAFSPLIGVWAPTFSAYELVAAFLLPFLAIRVMSSDRRTGAASLEQQGPARASVRIALKAAVLGAAWMVASLPAVACFLLWKSYGGFVHWPELASVGLGHLLNAGLAVGLSAAAASVAEHPSTAAILTLGFTVGTWLVAFAAAVHGGLWASLAALTPPALVAVFQRGLLRLDLVLIALGLTGAGLAVSVVWTRTRLTVRRRLLESAAVAGLAAAFVFGATRLGGSVDLTESRANSLPVAHERALAAIRSPLVIEIRLAQEDARRTDLERRVLSKLRRAVRELEVRYVSATSVGLFEQADPHYGEIAYEVGGRRTVSRLLTVEGVLEGVYDVAGIPPPGDDDPDPYPGHPLPRSPRGAGALFYVAWPALVAGAALFTLRRPG
jgi:hypothetical protein